MGTITLAFKEELDTEDLIEDLIEHCKRDESKPLICLVADADEYSTLDNIKFLLNLNKYASKEDVIKQILSL